jgi:hypothetical protein
MGSAHLAASSEVFGNEWLEQTLLSFCEDEGAWLEPSLKHWATCQRLRLFIVATRKQIALDHDSGPEADK